MQLYSLIIAASAAYLIGSVPFAVIVSRIFGLADPRTYGSGNPGATNVLRSGSKIAAGLTLLGDGLKGWFAVWLALMLGPQYELDQVGVACVAVAVCLGHLFPIFLRFRGGKGVATAGGVIIALSVWLALIVAATWMIVAIASRYSSMASLSAAAVAPLAWALLHRIDAIFAGLIVIAALIAYRHRVNISHLRSGTERRIGAKPAVR